MRTILMLATAASAALFIQTASAQAPSDRCDTESLQEMAPEATTVGFAAREPGGCRASGYVTTTNPGPNRVLFTLFLPNNFNGRYLYLGVGGAAGMLPSLPPALIAKGYALAGSDGGTGAKSGADYSFYSDPAKAMDYGGRGVRVTAAATQQITRAYYGREDLRRYISGCSGGGAMGMTNARRNGNQQFDGFLVGAVGWPNSAYMAHVYAIARHLQTHPEGWISPELLAKTQVAILSAYDGSDGAADGLIADQRNIARFDKSILTRLGYTPAQIETFELISQPRAYAGPGLPGNVTFPGFPITNVGAWSGFLVGNTPPPWRPTGAPRPAGSRPEQPPYAHLMADSNVRPLHPGLDYWSVADDNQLVALATQDGKKIPYADPMDFSALAGSGAKMIFYHGVNDPNISYIDTLAGYESLLRRFPGASSWLSAFAVPGLNHCRGGLGPTAPEEPLLEALVAWVEQGVAPSGVQADRDAPTKAVERTFLICAEPRRARLKQPHLDPKVATSWVCS